MLVVGRHSCGLRQQKLLKLGIDDGFGLGKAGTRLEPSHDVQPFGFVKLLGFQRKKVASWIDFRLHAERDPNVGGNSNGLAVESLGGDSNNVETRIMNSQSTSEHIGIAGEPVLPETVADHGNGICVANLIDFSSKRSAEDRIYTQHRKV